MKSSANASERFSLRPCCSFNAICFNLCNSSSLRVRSCSALVRSSLALSTSRCLRSEVESGFRFSTLSPVRELQLCVRTVFDVLRRANVSHSFPCEFRSRAVRSSLLPVSLSERVHVPPANEIEIVLQRSRRSYFENDESSLSFGIFFRLQLLPFCFSFFLHSIVILFDLSMPFFDFRLDIDRRRFVLLESIQLLPRQHFFTSQI